MIKKVRNPGINSRFRTFCLDTVSKLPNIYTLFRSDVHRIFVCNSKCIIPCLDMRQSAVYTPFSQRVRIRLRILTDSFFADVSGPQSCVCQEETLIGCEAVYNSQRSILCCIAVSQISHVQSSVVCQVLSWPFAFSPGSTSMLLKKSTIT